jgi:MSHA biogenesis protein MshO
MLQGAGTHSKGFTLVEMVVTIIVAAIISVGVVTYIGDSVEGFASSNNRSRLASSGRTVIDRIALELHNAVPNSVRLTSAQPNGDQCLELMPFVGATTYFNPAFTGAGSTQFEVVDFNPAPDLAELDTLYAVIYPISTAALYDSASSPGPLARVETVRSTYDPLLTPDACAAEPFAGVSLNEGKSTLCLADGDDVDTAPDAHRFSLRSPVDRVYLATSPVSFCVVGPRIYRYENYGLRDTQCTPSTPSCLPQTAADGRHLITNRLDNAGLTAFTLLEQSLRRNAMINFDLNFTDQGDVVELKHEIQMRNVP